LGAATGGGGGISPTFGAALWLMDYSIQLLLMGVEVWLKTHVEDLDLKCGRLSTSTKAQLGTVWAPNIELRENS
jgi:hypothetical protein